MAIQKSYAGELSGKLADYRSKGQREGGKLRPAQDAAVPDEHETTIRIEAEGWLAAEQHRFDTNLTELSRSSTEARQKLNTLTGQLDQLVGEASMSSAVEAEISGERQELVNATVDRIKNEAGLKSFRAANEIHEEAVYPESKLWHIGLVVGLALVETVINTFFYENSEGLLGGFFVALAITAMNIGFALLFGYWFRYKNLANIDKKISGWMALIAFLVGTIFCNALFSSFRTEYQAVLDPSDISQLNIAFQRAWPDALQIFRADMQFKDLWSFILFGLGILLGVLAFWKGYTLDDRFPGHGALDRLHKKLLSKELRLHDQVRQKVRDIIHRRKEAVQAALQEPATQVGMLGRRISDATNARAVLLAQAAAVQRDYSLVVDAYRSANNAVRAVPAPPYFKEPTILINKVNPTGADLVLEELKSIQRCLTELAESNRSSLNAKLKSLQEDGAEIMGKTISQYLISIQTDAELVIARWTPAVHRISERTKNVSD